MNEINIYKNLIYESIKVDNVDINQSYLNIEEKERSNFFVWNGQFSPQLIEILLLKYAPKKWNCFRPICRKWNCTL